MPPASWAPCHHATPTADAPGRGARPRTDYDQAEEVAKVYPELVTRNSQGQVEAIRYQELTPMLLNEVQRQQRQLGTQAREVAELKAQNARLQATVGLLQERETALAARLERLEAAAARAGTLASR